MHDDWVFEVPVYRVDNDAWIKDVSERVEARLQATIRGFEQYGNEVPEAERQRLLIQAQRIERPHGWNYNEVIAWVRLLWDGPGPVIKGYAWEVGGPSDNMYWEARRSFRRGFKPFPFGGGAPIHKVIEVWFDMDESDSAIYDELRQALIGLAAKGEPFHRRHVDLSVFDTIGPHVRWRDVMHMERRQR